MRLGVGGYGNGVRFFHAPFIDAADGMDLAGVVTRSPERRAQVAADYPGVPVFDFLDELLTAGVDAVTITTPPQTRRELVLTALAARVHVVADNPFAPTADDARELVQAAADAGVLLNIFQNRPGDTSAAAPTSRRRPCSPVSSRPGSAPPGARNPKRLGHALPREWRAQDPVRTGALTRTTTPSSRQLSGGEAGSPVPAEQAVDTLAVLDAARASAHGRVMVAM